MLEHMTILLDHVVIDKSNVATYNICVTTPPRCKSYIAGYGSSVATYKSYVATYNLSVAT
ncbi:hypothetical protein H5410_057606 [Solanum commersonii]|uniref:Uncharacterized protein n=1 Tax=Solanum commersonii TaxID=4109 RepID=A0A9J5WR34_SOLCO|nr:hypothetical protein H5410_057606 [Solanum commersonii]